MNSPLSWWSAFVAFAILFALGITYEWARGKRCSLCYREFGVWRRRYKGNGLWRWVWLCRKHRDEWDAKYSFKGAL